MFCPTADVQWSPRILLRGIALGLPTLSACACHMIRECALCGRTAMRGSPPPAWQLYHLVCVVGRGCARVFGDFGLVACVGGGRPPSSVSSRVRCAFRGVCNDATSRYAACACTRSYTINPDC
eukprot:5957302-Prymnesium_polylepis.1